MAACHTRQPRMAEQGGNGDAQACFRRDQGFGNAIGEKPCVTDANGGDEAERVNHACDGSKQAEQWRGGGAHAKPEEKMFASCDTFLCNGKQFVFKCFAFGGRRFGGSFKQMEIF